MNSLNIYVFILETLEEKKIGETHLICWECFDILVDILIMWKNMHPEFPNTLINPSVQIKLENCGHRILSCPFPLIESNLACTAAVRAIS